MIQTQFIYCGDNLSKLRELPDACVDLIYIDPPFNSNRDYEVFWGMQRQGRTKGFFVSFDFTKDAYQEIKRAQREMNLEIIPVLVQEILDEEVRYSL